MYEEAWDNSLSTPYLGNEYGVLVIVYIRSAAIPAVLFTVLGKPSLCIKLSMATSGAALVLLDLVLRRPNISP
jgi:hypothetical protein